MHAERGGRGRALSTSSASSASSDVSLVGLAAAAAMGSAASRYAEAKTILGSMTGTWAEARESKRAASSKTTTMRTSKGRGANTTNDGVREAVETTTASYERRHAAETRRGEKAGKAGEAAAASGGFGPNPYATLEKKSTEVLFENEVVALANEVARERERAVRDMRAKGMASRDASAEERRALGRAEEALRRAKAEQKRAEKDARREAAAMGKKRGAKDSTAAVVKKSSSNEKAVERAPAKSKETPEKEKRANKERRVGVAAPAAAGVGRVVVEIGKFVLPAVIAWFARQREIDELTLDLERVTAAKARADEEASKIRAKLVELRQELALAEKTIADQKSAAETLMNRRNSVKEVKMKQMAVDHNGQMKKVREDAAKEIQHAKSLEIGARWREEACRRMKNRAEATADELREKIEKLEAELERVKSAADEENPVAKVQHAVGDAVHRVASLAKSASKLGRPQAKDANAKSSGSKIPKPKKTIPKPKSSTQSNKGPAAGAFKKVASLVRSVSQRNRKNGDDAPAKE